MGHHRQRVQLDLLQTGEAGAEVVVHAGAGAQVAVGGLESLDTGRPLRLTDRTVSSVCPMGVHRPMPEMTTCFIMPSMPHLSTEGRRSTTLYLPSHCLPRERWRGSADLPDTEGLEHVQTFSPDDPDTTLFTAGNRTNPLPC